MSEDPTPIEALARKCATSGLKYRDAKVLFEALYQADALKLAGGNVSKAAEIAGTNRECIHRRRRAQERRAPE